MMIVTLTATAVGVIAIAGVGLSGAIANSQSKLERAQEMKYVTQGAVQLAASDLAAGRLQLNESKVYFVGGNPVTVTTTDNSQTLPNSVVLTLSGTSGGIPIAATQVISFTEVPIANVWSFGIYSNNGFTWPVAGCKVIGSVYFRKSINVLGTGGQITGDFKTSSSFNPLSLLSIQGGIMTGVSPFNYPVPITADYQNAAASVLAGNQVLNGYTFPHDGAILFVSGNVTLHGTVNNSGAIYATGDITIDSDLSSQSQQNKHLMVITPKNITFKKPGTNTSESAEGYFFAGDHITIGSTLTLSGALVGNDFNVNAGFVVNWDQWLTHKTANGQSIEAPQMWP